MIDLYRFALNGIETGIIIIDSEQRIVFFNNYIEHISNVKQEDAVSRPLGEVCPIFKQERYQNILNSVLKDNFSRFCSSKLHKAFVYPKNSDNNHVRQNMTIFPYNKNGESFAVIQINDITNEVNEEYSLTSLLTQLKKDYEEVKESETVNKKLAEIDALTGISNRHAITAYLDNIFSVGNSIENYALAFIDLDGFKGVNDTYGHLIGDKLLISFAGIIKSILRKNDFCARIGGDEFLIVLDNVKTKEQAEAVGKKILEMSNRPIEIDNILANITASIGIALYNNDINNTEQFMKISDTAMYQAKKNGKNKYVIL